MKNTIKTSLFIVMIMTALQTLAQTKTVAKGNPGPKTSFTGNTWVNSLGTDDPGHWSVAKVTFAAGAHSNWHTHKGRQIVVITEGSGYLKKKGKPLQILRKGDVAIIEPGEKHWHGATPNETAVQVVTNANINGTVVDWLEPVTAQEYKSGK